MPMDQQRSRLSAIQQSARLFVASSVIALMAATGCEVARSVGAPTVSDASRLVLTPHTAVVTPNATVTFTAVAFSASGDTARGTVTWSVSGGLTLTDSSTNNGRHLGRVKAGTDTGKFKVVAHAHPGDQTDSATVTVTTDPPPVATVVVSPSDVTLAAGTSAQLQATVYDSAGTTLSGRTVTWSSNAVQIATVSSAGIVSAWAAGSAMITATCEGKSAASTVTVGGSAPPPPPPTEGCPGTWPSAVYPAMPLSAGQAFYVSSSIGNDANPGTEVAPWKTIQKAFDALQPGQIAYLRAGTYGAFCSSSTFRRAGTLAAPITVRGYPGERAVLHGQVRLEGSYLRLANVVVEGPSCGTWGATTQQGDNLVLMVPGTSHHIEVSNSEIYHSGWHAGVAAGGDDIWILNNYIHDNGGFNDPGQENTSHGIYYHDGTRGVVANNILEHNRAKGLSARYSGNHILVLNNTVVGNGRSGMDLAENTHDWLFANNIVLNNGNVNGGVGINTGGSSGGATIVEINNVFWNNGTSGASNWDSNATIVNNIVADPLLVNPVSSTPSTTHQAYSNDYHLSAGSVALGFADITYVLPFDLVGRCRPVGGASDAGAYEQ